MIWTGMQFGFGLILAFLAFTFAVRLVTRVRTWWRCTEWNPVAVRTIVGLILFLFAIIGQGIFHWR